MTTNLTLPAVVEKKRLEWRIKGELHRDDIDINTGLSLPAVIITRGKFQILQWWTKGEHVRNEVDKYGAKLPKTMMILS